MNKTINTIKNELTWWKGMILLIVGIVIWAVRLESKVLANEQKNENLKAIYQTSIVNLSEDIRVIRNTQIRIAQKLGIEVEY